MSDAVDDLPEEMVIEFPEIEIKNVGRFDRLVLREPTSIQAMKAERELQGVVSIPAYRAYQIALVSQVSGAPRSVVEQLPVRKLTEAHKYVQGFIDAGQATGKI